jgi:hypothetical protein
MKKPGGDGKFVQNNETGWINLPQTKTKVADLLGHDKDILHQKDYCHVPKDSVPWILLVKIEVLINFFSSVRTSFEY